MPTNFHIVTGAPGSGKTAVLDQLGFMLSVVSEPAREVLADIRAEGRQPAALEREEFIGLLLERSIEKYSASLDLDGPVVFDRGIPDCAAYAEHLGASPVSALEAAGRLRYQPRVLFLAPWEAIYTTDDERTMSFDLTVRFHRHVMSVYERLEYELVEVPRASVDERAAFVRTFVTNQK